MKTSKRPLELLFILAFIVAPFLGFACDRSEIALDSISFSEGQYNLFITQSIGGGITGPSKGADNNTSTFGYSFYGSLGLTPVYFTPDLTSDFTQVTNQGVNAGTLQGSNFTIVYFSPGGNFTCVSSSAACGTVHTDIKQVQFTLNELPDSIRMVGVEGAGNPFFGCYLDSDMTISFGTLPVVWKNFDATSVNQEVTLDWGTLQETNTQYFSVQRSTDGFNFEEIGTTPASVQSSQATDYQFTDTHPKSGLTFYKVVQFDLDGQSTETEAIPVTTEFSSKLAWTAIGPNPTQEHTYLGFTVTENQELTLQLINLNGQVVESRKIEALQGNNNLNLDLSYLAHGNYIVSLSSNRSQLHKRITKI